MNIEFNFRKKVYQKDTEWLSEESSYVFTYVHILPTFYQIVEVKLTIIKPYLGNHQSPPKN